MFVDEVDVHVTAGHGGRGCLAFRREKYVPRGGPDGGDGGHGGSVILRVVPGTDSLADLIHRKHYKGQSGNAGGGANRTGRSGADLILNVPPGTLVRDRERGNVL